jgi:hypothetical protein
MPYTPFAASAAQDQVLGETVALAHDFGADGVSVWDLDGCLFDTRPRQVHILRELAGQRGWTDLTQVTVEHFVDWDLVRTMENAGIAPSRVAQMADTVKKFWWDRFFTSDYVLFDHAMPGGPALVRQVAAAGGHVVYLTGRDETMRAGTEVALQRFGFPLDGDRCRLMVKPDFKTDDTLFKGEALEVIASLGTPCLFLDNEPSNVNRFKDAYPQAKVVFVATDHSGKPVTPVDSIDRIDGFLFSGSLDPTP